MSNTPHALIAGAGIGGLTTALGLARGGWRVRVLERSELTDDIGAGLQISPNASAVLGELGVLPRLSTAGLQPDSIHIRRGRDGATIARLPLTNAEQRWGAPYLLVHRGDLQKALVAATSEQPAITIEPQTSVDGITTTDDSVAVTASRGSQRVTCEVDCLIGADGVRSFVRAWLDAQKNNADAQNKARHVAWRTLVKSDRVAPEMRHPESALWLGPKAHLVHYPLRGGAIINVIAVVDDVVPIDWTADIWSQSGDPHRIAARFATWDSKIRDLIAAADDWRTWPLVERGLPPVWSTGCVAILGDAAHSMLPFLAQGAAQAIEDAAVLAGFLTSGTDVATALARFGAARRARTSRVQAESRRQARIYHLAEPAASLRDLALRALGPERLLARYDWLYGGA